MKFGEVRVDEAEGLILAHSLRLPSAMLKKGRVLSADDVRALKESGLNFVTGARLEADDVGENDAARLLAGALAGEGVIVSAAFSGRCTLFAAGRGLVAIDRDRLDRLNLVDEAVAVATVPPFDVATPRQMLATIKIIPFGVDRRVIDTCAALAAMGGPLVSVRPFRPLSAALILTTLPGQRTELLEAAAAVTRARVAALDGAVTVELRCPHEIGQLERSILRALSGGCDLLLIVGATATLDRRDVVPAALQRAGGIIEHFGMPVDPGNLLLLGRVGTVPVVNLPGCARAPKPNGLDWVLRRLATGMGVKSQDIMRMGAGGLLKEMPSPARGHDPAEFGRAPREARIAGLILACGPAAVVERDGKPLVAHAVGAVLAAGLEPVVVVAGLDADEIEEMLPACEVLLVRCTGHPLAAGLAALPDDIDAAVIIPAEAAPPGALVHQLRTAFDPAEGRAICVPVRRGRRLQPVLLGRDLFDAATALPDSVLEPILADHAELVFEVVVEDEGTVASS